MVNKYLKESIVTTYTNNVHLPFRELPILSSLELDGGTTRSQKNAGTKRYQSEFRILGPGRYIYLSIYLDIYVCIK